MSQPELKKLPSLRLSQIRESRNPTISFIRLFFNALGVAPRLPLQESVPPPTGNSGSGIFEGTEGVRELSYGTDSRMAKSVFIGQVFTNSGANHQQ
jgi:hypothetical protein